MKLRDLLEGNNQPSEKDMVKAINKRFSKLNVNAKITGMPPKGELRLEATKEIPTKQLGDFGNIFKVVKVEISVGWDDNGTAIVLKYEWKFKDGGTNGHRIRYILPHGKSNWEAGI